MFELKLDAANVDCLSQVLAFVDGVLEAHDCSMKTQMQIDIAVEELYVNIASYAYAPSVGPATVRVEVDAEQVATITFIDEGTPFDPLKKEDPDVSLAIEDRPVGGLGIFMVKKSMDDVSYARLDGRNTLTIRKKIG